jgi:cytoskeletal protein CcmA (bactofilin family)
MFFKSKKKSRDAQTTTAEPSYIARDTSLEGNIICDGEIHIDGAVRGTVQAQTCLVDTHGEVHGEINAQIVYIRGRVIGPVVGSHVHIHAGAHVEGNVTNETISIENGAYVYGSIRHSNQAKPTTQSAPKVASQIIPKEPQMKMVPQLESMIENTNIRTLKPAKIRN